MRKKTFSLAALLGLLLSGFGGLVMHFGAQAAGSCTGLTLTVTADDAYLRAKAGTNPKVHNTTTYPVGTTTLTLTIMNGSSPDTSEEVVFTSTDGTANFTPNDFKSTDPSQPGFVPPPSPGQYKTKLTAGEQLGPTTVKAFIFSGAHAGCESDTITVTQFGDAAHVAVTYGDPVHVSKNCSPDGTSCVTASTRTAVVTLTDGASSPNPVADAAVTFSTSPAPGTGRETAAVADPSTAHLDYIDPDPNGNNQKDGTYQETVHITDSPSRQDFTITAADANGSITNLASVTDGGNVVVQVGDPVHVTLALNPTHISANGTATSTGTAHLTDVNNNPAVGGGVIFFQSTSPPPNITIDPGGGSADVHGDVTTTITAGTDTGQATITALISCSSNCGTTQDHKILFVDPPKPKTVRVTLNPFSIPADGKSTTTATATVTDQSGAPIKGCTVKFTRSGDPSAQISAIDKGDGTYTGTLVASSTAKSEVVSASATNSSGSADNIFPAQLVETAVATPPPPEQGYSLVGEDGSLYAFGTAKNVGDMKGTKLNAPIIGVAYAPGGNGYWLVAKDGGIFSFGTAKFYGSMGNQKLNSPVLGMAATPSGLGYWLFAGDGGIFSFGDAKFWGSTGAIVLNKPVVGIA